MSNEVKPQIKDHNKLTTEPSLTSNTRLMTFQSFRIKTSFDFHGDICRLSLIENESLHLSVSTICHHKRHFQMWSMYTEDALNVHIAILGVSDTAAIALWFNRGVGPKIQSFISGLFSTVCIDRLCQRESMMVTLSPGRKHQCTMEKTQ